MYTSARAGCKDDERNNLRVKCCVKVETVSLNDHRAGEASPRGSLVAECSASVHLSTAALDPSRRPQFNDVAHTHTQTIPDDYY